jgi:hypothetical protein
MKHKESSRQFVDRFLSNLGEPISESQSERATADVLERLRADNVQVVRKPEEVSRQSRAWVWTAIAAAIAVVVAGGVIQMIPLRFSKLNAVAKSVRGELHQAGVAATLQPSRGIEAGRVVRAGSSGGAIELFDGSQVEMSPNAELSIVREADGLLVQLNSGTVLVTAAKQHDGHLYVETKDCLVSVVGTVFAVSSEESGSRVSVIEGEVYVKRGDISQTLLAGQQASTSPALGPFPANVGNGWVDPVYLALLQQPQQPLPGPRPVPLTDSGVTVRGVVKQASSGIGIPDVTVTLCPASAGTRVWQTEPAPQEDQAKTNNPGEAPSGPIIRNKTFFFALWDQTVCQERASVVTDSSGRFQFPNVGLGEYVVTAEREGFAAASAASAVSTNDTKVGKRVAGNVAIQPRQGVFRYFDGWNARAAEIRNVLVNESQNVTVEAQKAPQDLSLNMIRAGVIAGRVRDVDGRLLVNASVRIVSLPAAGTPVNGITVISATTNDLGEYRAYWLLPGEYHVLATGPVGRPSSETWFPRGATATEASAVSVREGEEVSSIDVTLRQPLPSDAPVTPAAPSGLPIR